MPQPSLTGTPPPSPADSSVRGRRRGVAWLVPLVLLAFGFLFGVHFYLIERLVVAPALPDPLAAWLSGAVVALGASLVAAPLAARFAPLRIERLLVWPASIWMGVAFLLLVALLASDLLRLLLGAASDVDPVTAARLQAFGVLALVGPAAWIAVGRGLSRPAVRRIEIPLLRWPAALDGFRIVQISDIHLGPILGRDFAAWLTERVNGLAPDLVAVTGDLVDGRVAKLGGAVAPFADLSAPHGCFFVTGNHDHYSGARAWAARVEELGLTVLRNRHVVVDVGGERFALAGVDDHRTRQLRGRARKDLESALAGVDPRLPVILLAHDPTTFQRASRRVDLQLSGHTHGGQIWPFIYLVRLAVPWVAGLHRRGASTLYVSRGTGFWGPPMRLGAPAEITEIVLRAGGP